MISKTIQPETTASTKRGTEDVTNEKFVFMVEKLDDQNNVDNSFEPLYVTLYGNTHVTIKDIEAGVYRVTELTAWSWRYVPVGNSVNTCTVTGGSPITAAFTNKLGEFNWLHGENSCDNIFE
ncbi:MAG: hypothetical protein J5879_06140 [Clostridia bacterium]|nr:hypothetical protein [Clostridia bacterium]